MKKIFAVLMAIFILTIYGVTSASMLIPAAEPARENARAPEKSPVIGDNWDIERVDFIHYVKHPGKAPKKATCYNLMRVKWADIDLPLNYVINPINPQSLDEGFITSAISTSVKTWDDATSKELFMGYETGNVEYGIYDGTNAIAFGNYPQSGVIAVTSVWYTRVQKKILEFDMLFDTDFSWGDASSDPTKMDLQNIATHELGHAVGLNDVYSSSCSEVTMYGYSNYGEINKRDLELADITGLQAIYGN